MLELCALAALGYWGFRTTDGVMQFVLGLGAPLAMLVLWGAFVGPKAPKRLDDPIRLALELVIFSCASLALLQTGDATLGLLLAGVAAVNIGLLFAFHQRGS